MVLRLSRQATVHAAVAKGLAEHGPKSKDGLESAPRIYLQAAVQLDKPTRRRPLVAKALLLFPRSDRVVLVLGDVRCQ